MEERVSSDWARTRPALWRALAEPFASANWRERNKSHPAKAAVAFLRCVDGGQPDVQVFSYPRREARDYSRHRQIPID